MFSKARKFLTFGGVILSVATAWAVPRRSPKPPVTTPIECAAYLQSHPIQLQMGQDLRHLVLRRFKDSTIIELDDIAGFTLRPKQENSQRPLVVSLPDKPQDYDHIDRTIWESDGQKFRLLNVGFKHFEDYSNAIDRIVVHHLANEPQRALHILYSPDRSLAENIMRIQRWTAFARVNSAYKDKIYLTDDDLDALLLPNLYSSNSDVFSLLSYKPMQRSELKQAQNTVDLMQATIQIFYHGDRNYFLPDKNGLLIGAGVRPSHRNDTFIFEHRIRPESLLEFREEFYEDFDPDTTCQFGMYAIFENLPQAIKDQFILNAFLTAEKRGMQNIVASVDSATMRLYGHLYKMKEYKQLPVHQTLNPEYLVYLKIGSDEYYETINRLTESASRIRIYQDEGPR